MNVLMAKVFIIIIVLKVRKLAKSYDAFTASDTLIKKILRLGARTESMFLQLV